MTILGKTTRVKMGECTACHYDMDAAMGVGNNNGPSPGDATLCAQCGHVMIFTDDLKLRDPTKIEKAILDCDPRVVMTQHALAEINEKRRGRLQ